MVPNRSRPLLLVLHADHPDRSLDAAIGAWFVERVRAHERFDVEVLNAGAWDASKAGRAPAWRAPVARADALVFVATDQDAVLRPPLLDLVAHASDPWRFKPFGIVRATGATGARLARTLVACLRDHTAVPSREDVVLPDTAAALGMGVAVLDAAIAARAEAQLMDLARLHATLRPMRPARVPIASAAAQTSGATSGTVVGRSPSLALA